MRTLRLVNVFVIAGLLLGLVPIQAARLPSQPPPPQTTTGVPAAVANIFRPASPAPEPVKVQAAVIPSFATVKTGYLFSSTVLTYSAITGFVSGGDADFLLGANIGFPFHYRGVTYTDLTISSQGFVGLGSALQSYCQPPPINIPAAACNNLLVPLGAAVRGNPGGGVVKRTLGTAPNRVYVVQWQNYRFKDAPIDSESFNFQLRLYETSDVIEFVYGPFTKNSTERSVQVGLRGDDIADYQLRTTDSDWSNSTGDSSLSAMMHLGPAVFPTTGLTYAWTPVPLPDLTASTKTAPVAAPPGVPLTFTVRVANVGHFTATATLLDPIPTDVTYTVGSVACSTGACSYDGGIPAIRWNGNVAPFTTALVTYTVDITGIPWAMTVTNTATISDPLMTTPVTVSAVSMSGYATRPVVLTPNSFNFTGCNDGSSQTREIMLLNNTNQADTFDLTYALTEPALGSVTGPPTATLLYGQAVSLPVTLTINTCIPAGVEIAGQIRAAARASAYSDTAVFTKPLVSEPFWTSVPNSKPAWGGSGFPHDGCTAQNADGQWVTYLIGDLYSGSSLNGFMAYNHATNTWFAPGAANTPAQRYAAAWVYDSESNLCYLTGGANNTSPGTGTYNDAYRFDPVANVFTGLGNFTAARNFHTSWVGRIAGEKYLCVGTGINSTGTLTSTQCYTLSQTAPGLWAPENGTITATSPTAPYGAADGVLHATTGDQFWYVGGSVNDSATSAAYYWDSADRAWHSAGIATLPRYRVGGDFVNGDYYFVGGSLVDFNHTNTVMRAHFDGIRWVWTQLANMPNSRMDNIANAGGGALWSVDGYGASSTGYVDKLNICPVCAEHGWLTGRIYDYDGSRPPVTPYTLTLMPGNKTVQLDATGAYTIELVPWEYHLTAFAAGYPQPVTATLQIQDGVTVTRDFVLPRPKAMLNTTTVTASLYVINDPVSVTRLLTLTNLGSLPLTYRFVEFQPAQQRLARASLPEPTVITDSAPLFIEPALAAAMKTQGSSGYVITLRQRPDLSPAYRMNWHDRGWFVLEMLQKVATSSQAQVRAYLDKQGVAYQSFWIDNLIVVEKSSRATFKALQSFPEIASLRTIPQPGLIAAQPTGAVKNPQAVEPNLTHINANLAWAQGVTGTGVVVGSMDTGVRYTHQALVNQYRGNLGSGVFDHNYNWFDPYTLSASPYDSGIHGSHTVGTMVGDDGAGNQIGVAPGAQWIACQAFTPTATLAGLLQCGQFMAAPTDTSGQAPNPDKRPQIVNNSWGDCLLPGYYFPWFDGVLDAWLAGGLYPVFANGNSDVNCPVSGLGKVNTPAASPRVTAVGALGRADGTLASYSLWGPTNETDTWNPLGYPNLKPQVAAPGTNRSAGGDSDTGYVDLFGTSMAAPHVAGVVALMWSAAPCLVGNYTDTESLLMQTAVPALTPGYPGSPWDGPGGVPNQATGWGEVDAQAAVNAARTYCLYNWNPWVSESPARGVVSPTAQVPVKVIFTCAYSDTLKSQPLQSHLLLADNDPIDQQIALTLECRSGPSLRLAQTGPLTAASGALIPLTLTVSTVGNFSGTAVLTEVLPTGLRYAGALTATAGTPWESNNVIHWSYTYPRPQLHLPLDEISGTTLFADAGGYGNHGACTGNCPVAGVTGTLGRAVWFSDTTAPIVVTDATSLRNVGFTLSAWFTWDRLGTSDVNFITGKGMTNLELHTGGGAGVNGLRFVPAGYPNTSLDALNVITTGWNHVAAAYDGSSAYLYVNGRLAASRTITSSNDLLSDTTPFYLGRRSDGTYGFAGKLDDVRLYNRILSPAEIASLAAGQSATPPAVVTITLAARLGGSEYTWLGGAGTAWDTAANWSTAALRTTATLGWDLAQVGAEHSITPTGAPGFHDQATVPGGAPTYPVLNVNAGVNALTIQPGGAVTVPAGLTLTVESLLINSGTLALQRMLTGATDFHVYNQGLTTTLYYGAQITPDGALGPTWVTFQGDANCQTGAPLDGVRRCVHITPALTNTSATVRLYYLTEELAGHNPADLGLWQWRSINWLVLGATRGTLPGGGYVEGPTSVWGATAPLAIAEPTPLLTFTKAVTPISGVPYHGVVTYTLIMSNTGLAGDPRAGLTDTLPAQVTFGQWLAQPGGAVVNGNTLSWAGLLTPGTALTFSFTATQTGGYGEVITNTAWFSGTQQRGSATAAFQVNPVYTLTVGLSGNGSGTVTSIPAGINCGTSCAAPFEAGTPVTVTATPLPGSSFAGWSGAVATTTNSLRVWLTDTQQLTANFTLNAYPLTVDVVGQGQVTRVPSQATYLYGQIVTLTATPIGGWYFGQWSGDVDGTLTQTQVFIDGNKTVTATFLAVPPSYYTLTMALLGSGVLTPGVGVRQYLSGTVVPLSITPSPGWDFVGWSGAVTGLTNPTQITLDANKSVTATCIQIQYIITPTAGPGGSITPATPQTVTYGDHVTFTITPDANYSIADVVVDGQSVGAVSHYAFLNITTSHTITAAFTSTCLAVQGPGFTFTPLQPHGNEPVQFTGAVLTGTPPLAYAWAWGDGTPGGAGTTISHAFPFTATPQTYTITMNVSNSCSGPLAVVQTLTVMPRWVFLPLVLRNR